MCDNQVESFSILPYKRYTWADPGMLLVNLINHFPTPFMKEILWELVCDLGRKNEIAPPGLQAGLQAWDKIFWRHYTAACHQ